jgi:vanillate O-demethylase monooxygenase subunit
MRNLNAITPETETSSHYFWGQAHDFDYDIPPVTDRIFEQIHTAFLQDVEVLDAQQRNLETFAPQVQIDINADAGTIQARRVIERLCQEEQAGKQVVKKALV